MLTGRSSMRPTERIASAADRLAPNSRSVDILATSFAKLLANPHKEAFRKVNLANPTMKSVAEAPGAMELLHATGFEPAPLGHLLLNSYERPLLEAASAALQNVQSTNVAYAQDRARVQRESAQARAAAEAERIDDERRRKHAARVPVEPPEGAAGAAKICIHLGGDGNKAVWRRFDSKVDTLQDLLNFVKSLKGAPNSPRLENVTQLPSMPLDEKRQLGLCLHHLDLWPAGHVRVVQQEIEVA